MTAMNARVVSTAFSLGDAQIDQPGADDNTPFQDSYSNELVAIVEEAVAPARDAGIDIATGTGLLVNSVYNTRGNVEFHLRGVYSDPPSASARVFPNATSSVTAGKIAEALGLTGPVVPLNSSPVFPIALSWLRRGTVGAVIVASGEAYSPLVRECLASSGQRYFPEAPASYPKVHSAVVIAMDGNADTESATTILAYGLCSKSSARDAEAALQVSMDDALRRAGLTPADVSGVIMGTNLEGEAKAIATLFGPRIRPHNPWTELGNLLGASSIVSLSMLCAGGEPPPQSTFEADIQAGAWIVNAYFPPATFSSLVVERK